MHFTKLLEIFFQGRFMCRLATDPDPTTESRGASGYTMALASEPPLDQVIRLQPDPPYTPLRDPAREMGIEVGVKVSGVHYDGEPYPIGDKALDGARVRLEGRTRIVDGPSFQSRNNIVGSDDTMAMVVEPFQLVIEGPEPGLILRASDYLDPDRKEKEAWEFDGPSGYARRFPIASSTEDVEAMEAIGVVDQHGYFWDRRRYLERRIERWEKELTSSSRTVDEIQADIQAARSRIHQIDFWGVRMFNKLGFKTSWQHGINGERSAEPGVSIEPIIAGGWLVPALDGVVDLSGSAPWTVKYWFGGWDGDLLIGYMRGALTFPFLSMQDLKNHPQACDVPSRV